MFRNQFKVRSSVSRTFEMCELDLLVNNSNRVPGGAWLEVVFPP